MYFTVRSTFRSSVSRTGLILFMALIQCGCASRYPSLVAAPSGRLASCRQFFHNLDQLVLDSRAEDSGDMRVENYPFLRSNRFLASFAGQPLSAEGFAFWLEQLRQLDEAGRLLEFANLPEHDAALIKDQLPDGLSFQGYINRCGHLLVDHTLANDDQARKKLVARTTIPDNYRTWQRIAGAYPIARLLAINAIGKLHAELNAPFQLPVEKIPVAGQLLRYHLQPNADGRLSRQTIGAMLREASHNSLNMPILHDTQLARLFRHFAPAIEIDTRNPTDLIGTVMLDASGQPRVDTREPAVYVKHAYTRYQDRVLLQLVYQVWMPEREKTGCLDLYGGKLDSVLWRVTLGQNGAPIAYDSIHACGCYYLLFPGAGYSALPGAADTEPVLSPGPVRFNADQGISIRLAARTHYLQQVTALKADQPARAYQLPPYNRLRSLPTRDGRRASLFGNDGIVAASHRTERYFLWPFGVASPGAMRQWGHHAIAFIGRRHFDDPFLFSSLLKPLPGPPSATE